MKDAFHWLMVILIVAVVLGTVITFPMSILGFLVFSALHYPNSRGKGYYR